MSLITLNGKYVKDGGKLAFTPTPIDPVTVTMATPGQEDGIISFNKREWPNQESTINGGASWMSANTLPKLYTGLPSYNEWNCKMRDGSNPGTEINYGIFAT